MFVCSYEHVIFQIIGQMANRYTSFLFRFSIMYWIITFMALVFCYFGKMIGLL
ncbi:hypothetical protein Hanom_Chr17g01528601 [Helianthus anomalus]